MTAKAKKRKAATAQTGRASRAVNAGAGETFVAGDTRESAIALLWSCIQSIRQQTNVAAIAVRLLAADDPEAAADVLREASKLTAGNAGNGDGNRAPASSRPGPRATSPLDLSDFPRMQRGNV
jgi:hypothetical protein